MKASNGDGTNPPRNEIGTFATIAAKTPQRNGIADPREPEKEKPRRSFMTRPAPSDRRLRLAPEQLSLPERPVWRRAAVAVAEAAAPRRAAIAAASLARSVTYWA